MLNTISIEELQLGHYVTQVVEQNGNVTVKSRGKVKKSEFIQELRDKGIKQLEIDLSKSNIDARSASPSLHSTDTTSQNAHTYRDASHNLDKANGLFMEAIIMQEELINKLQKGAVNDLSSVKNMSAQIVENLLDNPNALSCLTYIKDSDKYLMEHSLNCCILMAMFAEHLGYDTELVEALSLGALLMDVGMANVPKELIAQQGSLSHSQMRVIENHVVDGLEMIEQVEDLDPIAKTVISQHHERIDGSGYPIALKGEEVSVFGRMAAIIDKYDEMISEHSHQPALPAAVALKRLARTPGLDPELVRQFINRIGIHPVGSLVKLKSGKLGIVSRINPLDMLNPVVMTFYSIAGAHYNDVQRVNLSKREDEIESSVQPSEFDINLPKFFRDVFINQVT